MKSELNFLCLKRHPNWQGFGQPWRIHKLIYATVSSNIWSKPEEKMLFNLIISLYLFVVLVSRWCSFVLKSCNHFINVVCEPDERSNGMFHWRFLQSRPFQFMTYFMPSVNFLKYRMKYFIEGFIKLWKILLSILWALVGQQEYPGELSQYDQGSACSRQDTLLKTRRMKLDYKKIIHSLQD